MGYDPNELFAASPPPPAANRTDDYSPDTLFSPRQQRPEEKTPPLEAAETWSDVPSKAVSNFIPSAVKFGSDIVHPFMHPSETAEAIGNLGKGIAQKTGLISGDSHTKYADAVWESLVERYGSEDALRKTMSTDPVGFMGDLSTILTGGGMVAARGPSIIGQVGQAAKTAGRLTDPLLPVAKTIGAAGKMATYPLGVTSGLSPEAIQTAAKAGYQGGDALKGFMEHMEGTAPMAEVVSEARDAVRNMKIQRGEAYQQAMLKFRGRGKVLPFDKIDDAMRDVTRVQTYTGPHSGLRVELDPGSAAIRTKVGEIIDEWRAIGSRYPQDFLTAEGLDALKKKLYHEVYKKVPEGPDHAAERLIAGKAVASVRNTISKHFPDYKPIMHAYEQASTHIEELERGLSLGHAATIDTSLRKLQSVLRHNVNTSYGHRKNLAEFLVNNGSPYLLEKLAGQSMQSWIPHGLSKLGASIMATAGAMLGGAGVVAGHVPLAASIIPAAAAASPRMVGHAASMAGIGMGAAERAYRPLLYSGRIADMDFETQRRMREEGGQ